MLLCVLGLAALVDEILPMVGDALESKQIRVERAYDPATPEALFDQAELRKAFLNFIINAVDASPAGGELAISIGTTGDVDPSATVTIRDRGHGMDEETLKQIANLTSAEYFYAGTAVDLKKIYQSLNSRFVLEKKETEITALFAALAALTVLLSAALSLAWFNRIL